MTMNKPFLPIRSHFPSPTALTVYNGVTGSGGMTSEIVYAVCLYCYAGRLLRRMLVAIFCSTECRIVFCLSCQIVYRQQRQ